MTFLAKMGSRRICFPLPCRLKREELVDKPAGARLVGLLVFLGKAEPDQEPVLAMRPSDHPTHSGLLFRKDDTAHVGGRKNELGLELQLVLLVRDDLHRGMALPQLLLGPRDEIL